MIDGREQPLGIVDDLSEMTRKRISAGRRHP